MEIKMIKNVKESFFVALIVLGGFLSACKSDSRYELIVGKWKCVDWLVDGKSSDKNLEKVSFEFTSHKTYKSILGSKNQLGEFEFSTENLVFYPDNNNGLDMQVKIIKLTNDSLSFLMNNSGEKEVMVLVKNK